MALKDLAKKKEPASKKKEGIIIETAEIDDKVNQWIEASRAKKDAEATMEQCEGSILEVAQVKWQDACRKNGGVETSAKVGPIRISWKGKSQFVTASSVGDGERAKAVFGNDYSKYFKEINEFEISPEAIDNEKVSKALEEALAKIQEQFPDINIVSVKQRVVATESLMNSWVMENTEDIDQKFAAAGIKRTKPTFAQR